MHTIKAIVNVAFEHLFYLNQTKNEVRACERTTDVQHGHLLCHTGLQQF